MDLSWIQEEEEEEEGLGGDEPLCERKDEREEKGLHSF